MILDLLPLHKIIIVLFPFDPFMSRLKQALKAGFKHLVFEDNYDTGTGDHYSFRQICDQFYIRGVFSFISQPANLANQYALFVVTHLSV